MDQSTVRTVLDRLYGAINTGDLSQFDAVVAADYVEHADGLVGRDAFKARVQGFREAFPDLHVSIEELIVDGDRFASRTTITGTHQGALMGMPATGRSIRLTAVDIGRIDNGQARERWGGMDQFALLQQLGALGAAAAG